MLDSLDIYVISLKNSKRYATCQAVVDNPPLNNHPIKFTFHMFDAIDKHSHYFKKDLGYTGLIENVYNPKWLKENAWFESYDGREMLPEELGCYASQYMLWIKCIESNKPICILEDDFGLQHNFYESLIDCLSSPFDLVRLWAGFSYGVDGFTSIISTQHGEQVCLTDPEKEIIFLKHFYFSVLDTYGNMAYYITPKAAKILVSLSLHWCEPVDQFFNKVHAHKLPCMLYIPFSVLPNTHNTQSTIYSQENATLLKNDPIYKKKTKVSYWRILFEKIRRIYYYHYFVRKYASLTD
ncbi:glycosyltransferase family 25 protein [Helicobacter suis]|uniref:glycosyltransferase family 25 protein n=2 Tax=Helicobacter suis TaxID=104628 RepID=UPI001F0799D8|nr:glycosyltransferase family 25 protein [Helicobacter suis]